MGRLSNWLSQVASITKMHIESLLERKGAALAAIVGIAGVVAVLVSVLSIAQGFRRVMRVSGDPATAMILRSGADSEMMSFILGPETRMIANAPGLLWTALGPQSSPELFVVISLPKRDTGTDANVPLRGVRPAAFQVHDEVDLIDGRRFEPGRHEVIVGVGATREFAGLHLGSRLNLGGSQWDIVGVFAAEGSLAESEIWTDASVLQDAYQRGNSYQSVAARLTSPSAFPQFKAALLSDPRLNVKVVRQTAYYLEQSSMLYNLITGLGTLIAALMAIGAVFGALNTMYTAVAARTREIATLRALGFGRSAVVLSVMLESLFLALAGGSLGATAAYLAFDGYTAATMNFQSFSQVAFAFDVTPQLLLQGVACAALVGVIGGLFPAIRAARLPVAHALREL